MPERVCQRPGCGRPIPPGKRRDARWCSRSCESKAQRTARRRQSFEAANPGAAELLRAESQGFPELHESAGEPDHWADLEAGPAEPDDGYGDYHDLGVYEDQDDGIHAGGYRAPDPWQERNEAFSEQMALTEAVRQIEDHYRELARPFIDQLRRNPGVRPPGLVRLEQECADKISALEKKHQRVQALEGAGRRAPQRVATAHERAVGQAAARAFAMDLGRGRSLRADPEPAGRDIHQVWSW